VREARCKLCISLQSGESQAMKRLAVLTKAELKRRLETHARLVAF
jgi:hypothetical protein